MKEEKRPFSITPSPEIPELEIIKAQMMSDVAVALIGLCNCYPCAEVIAKDAKRIVELCFSDGEEVQG